ncbi:MAG TPA: BREX-1 system adenine-specific DNA-methyltransferase PglX [Pyrinomonadaceae bacterium]|nr:BREX-1 system adenine-specific DNA-methyltransferase PglX [Pyrinomonadaceae bacterium]
MNKAKLKSYAPNARRDFIQMIRQRADLLGLTKPAIDKPVEQGDVSVIEGRPYPRHYGALQQKLADKIKAEGLEPFIERIAYSWFNRLAALRFMEVNNLLSHGFRVLSNREAGKNEPEILTHATDIDLPGLDKAKVIELKLAGNRDAELYKMMIIAQCNELNRAMPFLFERINDETEILLPDNLLTTDSVIRKMVSEIEEADWAEVEIIGWLYQFYISEKKDEVIGKTVKSEDIPAATQLFTPNWIVKYMTQNSLGRLWLEANPHSQLASQMEFYIEPKEVARETRGTHGTENESKIQNLKSKIESPEAIKILDPACGSGHILVEAYDLLKAIYTERGYSSRDIPLLILENNLFGLDIDERAAQMASFALLMKARKDDRRIFEKLNSNGQIRNPKSKIPNITVVPDSSHLEAAQIAEMFFSREEKSSSPVPIRQSNYLFGEMETQPSLMIETNEAETRASARVSNSDISEQNIIDLLELFQQGKTLGSLIRIPHGFGAVVERLETAVEAKLASANFYEQIAARQLESFVRAAKMLAAKYDCVIANPPYMGGKGMNVELKQFAAKNFPDSKSDLFAMFIERGFELAKKDGLNAMVTMQSWMFLSSFGKFRAKLLDEKTIVTMAHLGTRAFVEISGEVVQTTAFVMLNKLFGDYKPIFSRLVDLNEEEKIKALQNGLELFNNTKQNEFKKIDGRPIAYWISEKVRETFAKGQSVGDFMTCAVGLNTGDNERFLKFWHEVQKEKINFSSKSVEDACFSEYKWFPYNKGGSYRKWFGNNEFVLNFQNDGKEVKDYAVVRNQGKHWSRYIQNLRYMCKSGLTWADITTKSFAARYTSNGFFFDVKGSSGFIKEDLIQPMLGLLCSNLINLYMKMLNPTSTFQVGDLSRVPFILKAETTGIIDEIVEECVSIARADWDSFETSWDFTRFGMVDLGLRNETKSVEEAWNNWRELTEQRIARMQELETENNRLFIDAYGLQDELSPEVPLEQITLARADAEKDTRRLMSYFIGCLMGRYSLDEPGLIYADAGGQGFDASRYQTFPADDDGIVPVTDMEWFEQEAARQFEKFVKTVWGETNLSTNLNWIAGQLGGKAGETPIETVRRYFSSSFFKDHLQTYKKRPIYWLFSSGKQKAFECLVYLHRYNEATLPRMRHEYVLPLMSKLTAQIETLDGLKDSAATTSERNKIEKQLEVLKKKQIELAEFDEKLRHLADSRITLDLDDGVKVNYGKFSDLLAEVKQVATTKE